MAKKAKQKSKKPSTRMKKTQTSRKGAKKTLKQKRSFGGIKAVVKALPLVAQMGLAPAFAGMYGGTHCFTGGMMTDPTCPMSCTATH